MKVRKFITHTVALVLFSVAPSIVALGEPPPKQGGTPGITAPQAL